MKFNLYIFKFLVFIVVSLETLVLANEKVPTPLGNCSAQIELYCKPEAQTKEFRQVVGCLAKNDKALSNECKQEIQRFVQSQRQTTPAGGGGAVGALGGLTGAGAQFPTVSYEGRFLPSADSGATPSLTENSLSISVPVYKTKSGVVAATMVGGSFLLGDEITLDSGVELPKDFYRTEVGLAYSARLKGFSSFGIRGSVGYLGDKFEGDTETFNITMNYSYPGRKENTMWVWMLLMSNNGPFGIVPIPGFLYITRTPTFTGIYGIPVISLQWTPVNPWSFSFSALGPQVRTEATYGAIDRTQYFVGAAWKQQRFNLSDRERSEYQLNMEEKDIEIGLRKMIFAGIYSEMQFGYAMDRSLYIGDGILDDQGGLFELGSAWYARLSLRRSF